MPENVWKCVVEKTAVPSILKSYKVSNVKSEAHGAELRIISKEKPFWDAVPEETKLSLGFYLLYSLQQAF